MERGMKKIEKKRWISKGVKEKSGKFLEIPGGHIKHSALLSGKAQFWYDWLISILTTSFYFKDNYINQQFVPTFLMSKFTGWIIDVWWRRKGERDEIKRSLNYHGLWTFILLIFFLITQYNTINSLVSGHSKRLKL